MKAVPSFWGARDISRILDFYVHGVGSVEIQQQLDKLFKFMARQLPSKVLLSALLQSWPTIQSVSDQVGHLSKLPTRSASLMVREALW